MDDLQKIQDGVDNGSTPGIWYVQPETVVSRFAETVLGWSPERSYDLSMEPTTDGRISATLKRMPDRCEVDEDRGLMPCYPGTERITLAQPFETGEQGIWVIVDVRSPDLQLDALPGEIVANGSSLSATATVDDPLRGVVGAVVGDWHACGDTSGTSLIHDEVTPIEVRIAPDRETGSRCGVETPGYVWVATAGWHLSALADPLVGDSSPYVAVTAVPISVAIPENEPPHGTTPYTDQLGWTVDVPEGWSVTPIATTGRVSFTGAAFSNLDSGVAAPNSATPQPLAADPDSIPPDGIEVVILHMEGGPVMPLEQDDTEMPTTLSLLGCNLASASVCEREVRGNGIAYSVGFLHGGAPSANDVATAEALVASLRFPALSSGRAVDGWVALGDPSDFPAGRGTAAGAGDLGVVYVMRGTHGTYALDLEPDACGEGENQTWDPDTLEIWIQCPDYLGTGDVRYDRFGRPDPANDPAFSTPLDQHPVIQAWNGDLLLYLGTDSGLAAQDWP